METYEEITENKDEIQWNAFKNYSENEECFCYKWTKTDITKVIENTFPFEQYNSTKNSKIPPNSAEKGPDEPLNRNLNTMCIKESNFCFDNSLDGNTNMLFQTKSSKEYWDNLSYSVPKRKAPSTEHWRKHYIAVLPLNQTLYQIDFEDILINDVGNSMSEYEQMMREIQKTMHDQSQYEGERHVFYTSEDGIVFYSKKQLEEYKLKMAELKEVFHHELGIIKHQHDMLKAKKAEEKKLLSERMKTQEVYDEEPTEKDALNVDNNSKQNSIKQERKSALFSSFTDAFSYARTGIQGMFVKNSPSAARKMRSQPVRSESSDDEEETPRLMSQNPDALPDNHDEFTRKMTTEGGLKYTSSDQTDQQLSYQNLPPPFSLNKLPNKT